MSRKTGWRWRTRVLAKGLEKSVSVPLSVDVVVDEMYVSLESGEVGKLRGLNHQNVCAVLGVNRSSNALARLADVDRQDLVGIHDGYFAYDPVLEGMGLSQG